MKTTPIVFSFLLALVLASPVHAQTADGPSNTETRLRQALRDTTSQLHDAQSQLLVAQAAQAQDEKDKADLQAKLDALTTQLQAVTDKAAADKAAADKALADAKSGERDLVSGMVDTLTHQINDLGQPDIERSPTAAKAIADLQTQNPDFAPALDQYLTDIQLWTTGYVQYVQLQGKTEAERKRLAAQVPVLQQLVADREAKNLALYQLGDEILARYGKAGLGDALGAKEPFVGFSRVKLENLVQDYKNKLRDQVIVAGQPVAAPTTASGSTPAAPALTQK
jgi:DNA repair exonuclease SbcCD ATPase subunit